MRFLCKERSILWLIIICQAGWAQHAPKTPEAGEPHEFAISNFHSESGVTMPVAHIDYRAYGHINAAKDNVILLPSHYMVDSQGYEC